MNCKLCGKEYTASFGVQIGFCSHDCFRRGNLRGPGVCQTCGKEFFAPRAQRFCSLKCYHATRAAKPVEAARCLECGELIVGGRPGQKFCNRECYILFKKSEMQRRRDANKNV